MPSIVAKGISNTVARKTMAERYASQRSSKPIRRRTLPRLSDTATALEERSAEADAYDDGDAAGSYGGAGTATFTAGATPRVAGSTSRAASSALPRRPASSARRPGALAAMPTAIRVDYSYVRRDLRRIAITAVSMLILLIVLNIIVQHIIG